MSPPTPSPTRASRTLLWGIVAGLAAWGIFLAVGATGWFADAGLFDSRRSWIVLGCSAIFLGFWIWLLQTVRTPPGDSTARARRPVASPARADALITDSADPSRAQQTVVASGAGDNALNRVCLASLLSNLLAWSLWGLAWYAWLHEPLRTATVPLAWSAVGIFGVSTLLTLIGLSDPQRRRGQWIGLVTLVLLAAAVIAFIVQVQNYQATRALPATARRQTPYTNSLAQAIR